MKTIKKITAVFSALVVSLVTGETFDWTVDGTLRSYSLTEDVTFSSFDTMSVNGGSETNPNVYSIYLNGHTFTWNNEPWCTSGSVLASDRSRYPNPTLRIVGPGTASGAIQLGANGNGSGNGLWLEDGAVMDNGTLDAFGASRIVVSGGSTLYWNNMGCASIVGSDKGYVIVDGEGSMVRYKNGWQENLLIYDNSGFYLRNGAKVIGYRVRLGEYSHPYFGRAGNGSTIEIDDSSFLTEDAFYIGGLHDPTQNQASDTTDVKYPTIRFKGARAYAGPNGGNKMALTLYDQIGAKIEFEIPEGGYVDNNGDPRVPFKPTSFKSVRNRCEGRSFIADTVLSIKASEWMASHPGESITLMEVATAPAEGELAWLAGKVSFVDFIPECFDGAPSLTVSEDGRSLVLNAPARVLDDAFLPMMNFGLKSTTRSSATLSLSLIQFGAGASALGEVKLAVSKNADYSDADMIDIDASGLTKAGSSMTRVLESLEERTVYYLKLSYANNLGRKGTELELKVATGGDETTYSFANALGGNWEDASNWTVGSTAVTSWPTDGDHIAFSAKGPYTIRSTSDRSIGKIKLVYSDAVAGKETVYTLDLGGRTLTLNSESRFTGSLVSSAQDYRAFNPSLAVVNGTIAASSKSGKITLGNTGVVGGGGLIIGTGGRILNALGEFNSQSRVIVRDGGRLDLSQFFWRSFPQNAKYGFLYATGSGSVINATGVMSINGDYGGLIVHDLATVNLNGGVVIGNYNQQYFGHGADHAYMEVSNATVRAKTKFQIGDTHVWYTATQPSDTKDMDVKFPTLRLMGDAPSVAPADGFAVPLTIYDGLAARLEFIIPETGYDTIPVNMSSLNWVERESGEDYVNFGETEFVLDYKAWMAANPKGSLTLVKIGTPNKEGLERLISKSSSIIGHRLPADCLKVSDDGTEIVLTAVNIGLTLIVR